MDTLNACNSEFVREMRYFIIKLPDAYRYLTQDEVDRFYSVINFAFDVSSNYISVFFAESEAGFNDFSKMNWKFQSRHDSYAGVGMDCAILPSIISKRGNISLTNSKMKLDIQTKKFKNGYKKLIPA